MKKFIIMSLAVFALALVSCQSDKQKCENEGKVWKAETKTCISTKQAECEEKETMAWNEEKNTCEEKNDETSQPQEGCNEGEKWEDGKCVAEQTFTILLKSTVKEDDEVKITLVKPAPEEITFEIGKCKQLTESEFKSLKISMLLDGDDDNEEILCDNDDTTAGSPPCSPGNYEVWYNHRPSGPPNTPAIGYTLTKKEEAATGCKKL